MTTLDLRKPADVRLLGRAVREKWDIPEQVRRVLPAAMGQIALDKANKARDRNGAARVLVAMMAENNRGTDPVSEPIGEEPVEQTRRLALAAARRRLRRTPGRPRITAAGGGE